MLLLRHAVTGWNAEGRKFGHTDIPLSSEGRTQAQTFDTARIIPCPVIYTSPLARAHETAQLIGLRLHIPVIPVPALTERDHGDGDGMTALERAARFPDGHIPGREPDWRVRHRAETFLAHADPHALIVTHYGVIESLTGHRPAHLELVEWTP